MRLTTRSKLVSIIIPVYNVEKYLEACLDSVLNQTYKNIEIIAVDDGSLDSSVDILEKYTKKHSNLRIYIQKYNQGQGVARNIALSKAQGDFILFVDSDDYIESHTVEVLVEKILETKVDFIRFNGTSFSSDGENIKSKAYNFENYLQENKIYRGRNYKDIYLSFVPSPVLYMFDASLLSKHNITFPAKIIHEDEVFSTLLFLYAESCLYLNESFYRRRYRPGSTMTNQTRKQNTRSVNSYLKIIMIYQELLMKEDLSSSQRKFIEYRINSIYNPLYLQSNDTEEKEIIEKYSEHKFFYTTSYKNYIRFLKMLLIVKNKLS